MLILVIGDLYIPERAIDIPAKFKKLLQPKGKIEKVLCLGNITNSPSTLSFLKNISNDFQMIRGEDDSDLSLPQSLVMTYDSLKIGLINGFQIIPKNDPLSLLNHARMMDADVLIYGSTHKVEAYTLDGKFFVNPGTGSGAYSTGPLDKQDKLMINKIIDSVHKGENLESNKQKIDTADDHINDHSNVEKVTTDKLNNNDNKDLPKDSPAVDVNQDNHDNDNNNSNDDDDDDDNDNNNDDDNNENKITNNQGDSVPDSNLVEASTEAQPTLDKLQLHDIDEYMEPFPSFCLLDVKDHTCTLYLYTLVDGEVKIDKLVYSKEQ